MTCAIWGTRADTLEKTGDYEIVDSPRAGGKYWVSGTAQGSLRPLNNREKGLLTTWLCEQRHAGVEIPRITTDVLEMLKSRRPKSVPQRLTSALCFLGKKISVLGGEVALGQSDDKDTQECFAETESTRGDELFNLYRMLQDSGHVEGNFFLGGGMHVKPTVGGWTEIDRLTTRQTDSSQAFVAMWFSDATNDAFTKGIAPAILDSGSHQSDRRATKKSIIGFFSSCASL